VRGGRVDLATLYVGAQFRPTPVPWRGRAGSVVAGSGDACPPASLYGAHLWREEDIVHETVDDVGVLALDPRRGVDDGRREALEAEGRRHPSELLWGGGDRPRGVAQVRTLLHAVTCGAGSPESLENNIRPWTTAFIQTASRARGPDGLGTGNGLGRPRHSTNFDSGILVNNQY